MGEGNFCNSHVFGRFKNDIMIAVYIVFGILAGVLGGMGMGGGTILIPLLTIFFNINQTIAQGFNLLAFLPMSIFAILIHKKSGLIEGKNIVYIIIPGLIFAVLGSFTANLIDKNILKILFGCFLLILSIIEFIKIFKK